MKQQNNLENEIDKAFRSINNLPKVEPPDDIYQNVMLKIEDAESNKTSMTLFLKWAAIALLVLINAISYLNYNNLQKDSKTASVTYQVSDLVADYGLNEYDYGSY